ncbi:hypothetical protein PFLUV_G00003970 [Perca fluviatilis]|uniref:Uncharacterized protein n=1 Tax=Perca fluviatilis TaxID=8168 RepID=A0A6A5FNA9_PERFL|nr:hypothetical protein PFLUV_G00003970 [Perca fluviatilis]
MKERLQRRIVPHPLCFSWDSAQITPHRLKTSGVPDSRTVKASDFRLDPSSPPSVQLMACRSPSHQRGQV